jgi:replicative DNA helicase
MDTGTATNKQITAFYAKATENKPITATTILDAAKDATDGKPEILADQMFSLTAYNHLKKSAIDKVLGEYRQCTTEAREKAALEKEKIVQKETAAKISKQLQEEYIPAINSNNNEKANAIIKTVKQDVAAMEATKTAKDIFPSLKDIQAEWESYDPEKDFRPPILTGVALKEGTLSYIGARPSIGKTTILINIAREALDIGRRVIFLTLEEPSCDILRKLILSKTYAIAKNNEREKLHHRAEEKVNVNADFFAAIQGRYIKGKTEEALEFKELIKKANKQITEHYSTNLIFCEGRNISDLEGITAAVTQKVQQGYIVLVDYIQRLPTAGLSNSASYMIGKAQSNCLFNIAHDTGAIVISGAQFNRSTKDISPTSNPAPEGYKPIDETCFRESGDIEQDGDYVFGISEGKNVEEAKRCIEIMKVRSGSGRGKWYALDFQGAFNYMAIGDNLPINNNQNANKPSHPNHNSFRDGQEPEILTV